jgi:hypothetical protein
LIAAAERAVGDNQMDNVHRGRRGEGGALITLIQLE